MVTATAVTVVGLSISSTPVVSHVAMRLVDTTIGIGGSFDGFGVSIPLFFYGTAVPQGDSFHVVPYPAQINLDWPIISALPGISDIPYWPHSLKQSERIGAGYLEQDIAKQAPGQKITILGMSQGAQVAELARADMAKNPTYTEHADDYAFTLIGDPYQPNGGILSRFTAWNRVPILGDLFPLGRPGPSDSPFQTTVYQNQYDGFADFPAYFNPLAIVNAVMGIVFEHVLPGYVAESKSSSNTVTTTVGKTTYVTFPQRLPLLAPLRLAASLIGAPRIIDAIDPILRVFIESAYDRTADPSQVKEFSWMTPGANISAVFRELPGALRQSLEILRTGKFTPTLPQPTVDATEPVTPTTNHPAHPVDMSPLAQAIRQTVVNLSATLTKISRPLAKLLQVIGGQKPASVTPPSTVPASALPAATPRATLTAAAPSASVTVPGNLPASAQPRRSTVGPAKPVRATRPQPPKSADPGHATPGTNQSTAAVDGRSHESAKAATKSGSPTVTKRDRTESRRAS